MERRLGNRQRVTGAPIGVLIVDDHVLMREGVRAVLETQPDMVVAGEAANGADAIAAYARLKPDVVLMDLQMPDMSGVDAIVAIRSTAPEARIIMLTTFSGDGRAISALRAGAMGYLLKASLRNELLDAIRSVYDGGKHLDASVATAIALHVLDEPLSEREAAVLSLAALGNSNKQIAARLAISEDTVKGHMKASFAKLGASDRTHAVMLAARRGLIDL
ncbi:response regulator transcription factor [Polymorphobacter fuscus]|uniref:Response regulator n=1 Tax=Sandarakinorhabdus fusca TaxID=1439888 RepID=A0A7C9GMQ2_9SPHN|nr:response regulator transcription factor [Polymorphobacter fuscus]KAB7648551.1 response regulator transcription factor [Polymorphobacter fuscus]MQT16095.1 response regulator [Polymorphobacter fuscus]NJC07626.1 DNA-binding NarL/FixJ family response regulator [Polymorphobacter fuscus]